MSVYSVPFSIFAVPIDKKNAKRVQGLQMAVNLLHSKAVSTGKTKSLGSTLKVDGIYGPKTAAMLKGLFGTESISATQLLTIVDNTFSWYELLVERSQIRALLDAPALSAPPVSSGTPTTIYQPAPASQVGESPASTIPVSTSSAPQGDSWKKHLPVLIGLFATLGTGIYFLWRWAVPLRR